jgi:prevent-host-death family protein
VEPAPDIIAITDFRRDAAGIISGAVAGGAPVFVTQHGRVTAVLLSRDRYDGLLRGPALGEPEAARAADPLPAAGAEARPESAPSVAAAASATAAAASATASVSAAESPRLVETLFGPVDPETADFLASEGFGVKAQPARPGRCEDGEAPAQDWARSGATRG